MSYIQMCKRELSTHSAPGYHELHGLLTAGELTAVNFPLPSDYVEFVTQVGYGWFFASSLRVFGLQSEYGEVLSARVATDAEGRGVFIFGDNGVREGYYCFNTAGDVCYYFCHDSGVQMLDSSFSHWIESEFSNLFSDKVYSAYRKIRDPQGVQNVMAQRKKLSVSLVGFDKELVRIPGDESAFLPRYNRLVFRVWGTANAALAFYTVRCMRTGSRYGAINVDYVSLPLKDGDGLVDAYLFDPFNVPFEGIEADCGWQVDLSSETRISYKELLEYL